MRFRSGLAAALACVVAAAAASLGAGPVQAQAFDRFSRSYVNPFPEGDRYRMVIFGDSLGDGVWAGLYRAFKEDANVDVVKRSRVSTGFVRVDYFNWNTNLKSILKNERVHIAVIMVGANDMQAIREKQQWHKVGTEGWRNIYGTRIDTFIKKLKDSRAAVYWVGLPIMRSPDHNRDMQVMNEVFREKAFLNGVKFIDTWNGFVDEFGRYSAYGPDLAGRIKRLRAGDGVHFTMKGYRKLAHFVEREIRRDLRVAKSERNIPLAGDVEEQSRAVRRAVPRKPSATRLTRKRKPDTHADKKVRTAAIGPKDQSALPGSSGAAAGAATRFDATRQTPGSAPEANIAKKASKAIAGVELVRPELKHDPDEKASVGYAPQGETIAGEMGDGLTALASISPFNDPNLATASRRLPLAQRPYYRVLVKGEQLRSKTGRADDFSWPSEPKRP